MRLLTTSEDERPYETFASVTELKLCLSVLHKPTSQSGSGRAVGSRAITSCFNHPLAALFPLTDSPIAPGRTRPTVTPAVTAPASFTGESIKKAEVDGEGESLGGGSGGMELGWGGEG